MCPFVRGFLSENLWFLARFTVFRTLIANVHVLFDVIVSETREEVKRGGEINDEW